MLHEELTNIIIGAFYKVYENSLKIELLRHGLRVEQQKHIKVHYEGLEVGDYFVDLLVND
ncbi:MAG: GxxExxY protein [Bacteroidota bacterium]|nr:GxxExxY protein [Bacteroidota bacterium]